MEEVPEVLETRCVNVVVRRGAECCDECNKCLSETSRSEDADSSRGLALLFTFSKKTDFEKRYVPLSVS